MYLRERERERERERQGGGRCQEPAPLHFTSHTTSHQANSLCFHPLSVRFELLFRRWGLDDIAFFDVNEG